MWQGAVLEGTWKDSVRWGVRNERKEAAELRKWSRHATLLQRLSEAVSSFPSAPGRGTLTLMK